METAFIIYFIGWVLATLHFYYHLHRFTFDGESLMISLLFGFSSWGWVMYVIYDWYISVKK